METKKYSYECYFLNPVTKERGWKIENVVIYATSAQDARIVLKNITNFDCIISTNYRDADMNEDDIRNYANCIDFYFED